jgi:hypothetical protein
VRKDECVADSSQDGTDDHHDSDVNTLADRWGVAEKIWKRPDMVISNNGWVNKIRLHPLNQAGGIREPGEYRE